MNKTTEELQQEIDELKSQVAHLKSCKRYGLVWEDKKEEFDKLSRNSFPVLTAKNDDNYPNISSNDPSNQEPHILIEGDNYHSLSILSYTHKGKIDVIYIDPPYNTGNDEFKYNDKFIDKDDFFRHSKWLSFMDKRLRIAKDLLANDGVIYISIDDNEQAQLKLLCNEIFGEKNSKTICIQMSESSGLKMASVVRNGSIPKLKEYLIIIRKGGVKNIHLDGIPKGSWDNEYNTFLENFTKDDRNYINKVENNDDITESDIRHLDEIANKIKLVSLNKKTEQLNIKSKNKAQWLFDNSYRIIRTAAAKSVYKLAIEKKRITQQDLFFVKSVRGLLYFAKSTFTEGAKNPRVQIIFADDNLTKHPGDLWTHIKTTGLESEGGVEFKNGKKPLKLISILINSIKKEKLTVLDFFSGSGTTAHAVLALNNKDQAKRQFILCTNNENNICEDVTYKRIKNAIKGYKTLSGKKIEGLGGSLKYLKTDFIKKQNGKNITDEDKIKLTYRVGYVLALKENTFNEINRPKSKYYQIFSSEKQLTAIYFSENKIDLSELVAYLAAQNKPCKLYIFSWTKGEYKHEFSEYSHISAEDIPEPILDIYKNIGVI